MLAQRFDWCVAFALLRILTYDLVTRSELEPPKVSSDVTKTASDRYSVIVFSCADNVNSLSRPFIRDSKLGPSAGSVVGSVLPSRSGIRTRWFRIVGSRESEVKREREGELHGIKRIDSAREAFGTSWLVFWAVWLLLLPFAYLAKPLACNIFGKFLSMSS